MFRAKNHTFTEEDNLSGEASVLLSKQIFVSRNIFLRYNTLDHVFLRAHFQRTLCCVCMSRKYEGAPLILF